MTGFQAGAAVHAGKRASRYVSLRTAAEAQAALANDGLVLLREARHDGLVDGRRLRRLVYLLVARARPPVPGSTMYRGLRRVPCRFGTSLVHMSGCPCLSGPDARRQSQTVFNSKTRLGRLLIARARPPVPAGTQEGLNTHRSTSEAEVSSVAGNGIPSRWHCKGFATEGPSLA